MSSPAARAALVVLVLAASAPLRAATITVNSTDDLPAADDGKCTLREAVDAANGDTASGIMAGECAAGAGIDRIEFSLTLPATIALNLGPLALTDSATIAGPGAASLRIEGQ